MTPAQVERWGEIPEECPVFEFCHGDWQLREAAVETDREIVWMVDPETGSTPGWFRFDEDATFYRPMTRAARELLDALGVKW